MNQPADIRFLLELEEIVRDRIVSSGTGSYTSKLVASGVDRVAQKLGEEALEVALASVTGDDADALKNEIGDLLYHLIVLLAVKNIRLTDIAQVLSDRHRGRSGL